MKIASFNVENLFSRVRAMNLDTWSEGKPILEAYAKLNTLIQQPVYSPEDKQAIIAALKKLGLGGKDDGGPWAILRQNRGQLVKRATGGVMEIVATGRGDWIGWVELKREAINEAATRNIARVISDIDADIVALIEAEDRVALQRFNHDVLATTTAASYDHIMLIDGNDERGIDVAIMTKAAYLIDDIRSHVDDGDGTSRIFSRDCAEYTIMLPGGGTLLLMVNHLKSKGYGGTIASNKRRKRQAARIAEIYNQRRAAGIEHIAIAGDLNDTPESDPLSPLIQGTDLRDISDSPAFQSDGHPGTYANGTKSQHIDYILLSPMLFAKVQSAGFFRKGVWGNKDGKRWPKYEDTMTRPLHAASDHAAIWAVLDL